MIAENKKATGQYPPFYETKDFKFYSHWANYSDRQREHLMLKVRSKIITDPLPPNFVMRARIKRRQRMMSRDPSYCQKYLDIYDD
jgi:hypothetical protein